MATITRISNNKSPADKTIHEVEIFKNFKGSGKWSAFRRRHIQAKVVFPLFL